jgi:hypothetical protein
MAAWLRIAASAASLESLSHNRNRAERKEVQEGRSMAEKIQSGEGKKPAKPKIDWKALDIVYPDAAGIDIGGSEHWVAISPDRDPEPVRRFDCFTQDLQQMADWLIGHGVSSVAMQSTGVYWIAVFEILQQRGLEVYLVNARHTKNLPGCKSDIAECQWLLKLHTFGLLNNSFQPSDEVRRARTLWRHRGGIGGTGQQRHSADAENVDRNEYSTQQRAERFERRQRDDDSGCNPERPARPRGLGGVGRPTGQSFQSSDRQEPGRQLARGTIVRPAAGNRVVSNLSATA